MPPCRPATNCTAFNELACGNASIARDSAGSHKIGAGGLRLGRIGTVQWRGILQELASQAFGCVESILALHCIGLTISADRDEVSIRVPE